MPRAHAASLTPSEPRLAAPLYVFLASELAKDVTGQLFSAAGGYVGLHASPTEVLVGLRDEAQGPWPVEELAEKTLAMVRERGERDS